MNLVYRQALGTDASELTAIAFAAKRDEYWLEYCWVLPDAAGAGIGGTLVRRALGHAAALDARTLKVLSDPNAEGFYRRMGFQKIGDQESKPEGRRLPLMQAIVADTA